MLTLNELKEKVSEQLSEYDIIDVLGISSWDLVNAFEDRLESRYQQLVDELTLGETEDEQE